MIALRAQADVTAVQDRVESDLTEPSNPTFKRAVDAVFALDERGYRLDLSVQDQPYEALIKISESLHQFGLSHKMSDEFVEAIESQAIHIGVDFTKKAKPTPMEISLYVMDKKPELSEDQDHYIVAWDGLQKFGGDYHTDTVVEMHIDGTRSTRSNVPKFEEMFNIGGKKYLTVHLKKLKDSGGQTLDETGADLATFVEAVGPAAAGSAGGGAMKSQIESGTISPAMKDLITTVAETKQVIESSKFERQPEKNAPRIVELNNKIVAQTHAVATAEKIPAVVAKAVSKVMDQGVSFVQPTPKNLTADTSKGKAPESTGSNRPVVSTSIKMGENVAVAPPVKSEAKIPAFDKNIQTAANSIDVNKNIKIETSAPVAVKQNIVYTADNSNPSTAASQKVAGEVAKTSTSSQSLKIETPKPAPVANNQNVTPTQKLPEAVVVKQTDTKPALTIQQALKPDVAKAPIANNSNVAPVQKGPEPSASKQTDLKQPAPAQLAGKAADAPKAPAANSQNTNSVAAVTSKISDSQIKTQPSQPVASKTLDTVKIVTSNNGPAAVSASPKISEVKTQIPQAALPKVSESAKPVGNTSVNPASSQTSIKPVSDTPKQMPQNIAATVKTPEPVKQQPQHTTINSSQPVSSVVRPIEATKPVAQGNPAPVSKAVDVSARQQPQVSHNVSSSPSSDKQRVVHTNNIPVSNPKPLEGGIKTEVRSNTFQPTPKGPDRFTGNDSFVKQQITPAQPPVSIKQNNPYIPPPTVHVQPVSNKADTAKPATAPPLVIRAEPQKAEPVKSSFDKTSPVSPSRPVVPASGTAFSQTSAAPAKQPTVSPRVDTVAKVLTAPVSIPPSSAYASSSGSKISTGYQGNNNDSAPVKQFGSTPPIRQSEAKVFAVSAIATPVSSNNTNPPVSSYADRSRQYSGNAGTGDSVKPKVVVTERVEMPTYKPRNEDSFSREISRFDSVATETLRNRPAERHISYDDMNRVAARLRPEERKDFIQTMTRETSPVYGGFQPQKSADLFPVHDKKPAFDRIVPESRPIYTPTAERKLFHTDPISSSDKKSKAEFNKCAGCGGGKGCCSVTAKSDPNAPQFKR